MAPEDPPCPDEVRWVGDYSRDSARRCQPFVCLRDPAAGHLTAAGRVATGSGHGSAGNFAADESRWLYPPELGAGPVWANTVLVCAILFGLFAGYATKFMRRYGFTEESIFKKSLPEGDFHDPDYPVEELRCDCGKQLSHRVNRCTHNKFLVFLAKFWEGFIKIGKFVLLGVVIEVLALQFIPTEWISGVLEGNGVLPIIALTFATIPLHLPQVTAAAMLYGFVSPEFGEGITLSKGAGIALLVGGPVTALPVMALFIAMFKKRVLALYLAICISGTLILAFSYRALPFF